MLRRRTLWPFTICVLAMLCCGLIRYRLRDMPLERDEGEYAYAGQLLREGVPPYQLAWNMKLPGTYAAYAALMGIFGETPGGIHEGLMVANALTTLLIFFLAWRWLTPLGAAVSSVSFAVLSMSPSVMGFAAHATHFVILFAVGGLLVLDYALEGNSPSGVTLAGVLLGAAFLMKQPGGVFVASAAGMVLIRLRGEWRRLLILLGLLFAGFAIPLGVTCALLARAGAFERFWFWTVTYGWQYGTRVAWRDGLALLIGGAARAIGSSFGIWALAGYGLWILRSKTRLALLLGFSFLGTAAGLYFRPHYFILMLPAVALGAGAATAVLKRPAVLVPVLGAALGSVLWLERDVLFRLEPSAAIEAIYGREPFADAVTIGRYLREHSDPQAKVAVLGSEPEIYFYAHRRSATGYIYTYALMESQPYASQMQREMIAEIERAQPEFVVSIGSHKSWLDTPSSDQSILEWGKEFTARGYERVDSASQGDISLFLRKRQAGD